VRRERPEGLALAGCVFVIGLVGVFCILVATVR